MGRAAEQRAELVFGAQDPVRGVPVSAAEGAGGGGAGGTAPAAAGEPVQCPRLPDLSGRPTPPRPGAVQRPPVVHPAPAGGAVGDSGAGVLL